MMSEDTYTPETVVVTAPADLHEGYTFDAQANGKTFKVTVPPGGVKAGDEIRVPFPKDDDNNTTTTNNNNNNNNSDTYKAPTGKFKNGLFDCFQTFPCPFFMSWCCPGILAGQVLQRLHLNPMGLRGDHTSTCMVMTGVFCLAWVLTFVLGLSVYSAGWAVWYLFYVYVILALTFARNEFRKRYSIPASTFKESGPLDDCCYSFWCGCCTLIQMHRHTHDETKYPYEITSKTGLSPNAPEIV